MGRLLWLPEQLRKWGVPHVLVPGWETRGVPAMNPEAVIAHHDAFNANTPALRVLATMINGRADLPGPLCHLWIDDDHDLTEFRGDPVVFVVASGRANHAGPGSWFGVAGNSRSVGIEARNNGLGEPWSPLMQAVYWRTVAACLDRMGRHSGWVCFPGDTTVLCRDGLKFIEDVAPGDEVLTHRNRWRRVTRVTAKPGAATVRVRGHGHPGLRCTPDHPIRSFAEKRGRVAGNSSANNLLIGDPEWVEAAHMSGRLWSTPIVPPGDEAEPPGIEARSGETARAMSAELMWVIGRWVADGSSDSDGQISIYGGPGEAAEIEERTRAAGFRCSTRATGPNVTVTKLCSLPLHRWFTEHFGKLAHGKRLPGWIFGVHEKYRRAFLDGYLSGDGHEIAEGRWEASTVSKRLAFGIKILGQTLGYTALVYYEDRGPESVIEGRTVNLRPRWRVRLTSFESSRQQFWRRDGFVLSRVRSVDPDEPTIVYDLTVEEDHSFVADSIVVHNCGHKEWAPRRKIDPTGIVMNEFRGHVGNLLAVPPS